MGESRIVFSRTLAAPATSVLVTKIPVNPPKAAPAVGPYNTAVRAGELLFCSGQIPLDPETGQMVVGDIKNQTRRVLENVKTILEHEKLTFANVVKATVYLTDMGDFSAVNEIYAEYFTEPYAARAAVAVSALPKGADVEIEVIAHY
jgi:2-iminobutanoate/2-iminopropanoate deaminase